MTPGILLGILPLLLGGDPSPPPPAKAPAKAAARKAEPGKTSWVSLEEAIAALRKDYRPVLIILHAPRGEDGAEPAPGTFAADLRAALADPETVKVIRAYVCVDLDAAAAAAPYPAAPAGAAGAPGAGAGAPPVPGARGEAKAGDVKAGKANPGKAKDAKAKDAKAKDAKKGAGEPADPPAAGGAEGDGAGAEDGAGEGARPPSAGRKLGIAGAPALVILDFRENVVRRIADKLPRRDALRKELRAIAAELARQAAAARKVEAVLEEAEYSYKLGETRKAVLAVLPFDDPAFQRTLDGVLVARVVGIIGRYRKDASTAIAAGDSLEKAKKYVDAVGAYQDASRKYPFPDVLKESARKQGAAMRKARGLF